MRAIILSLFVGVSALAQTPQDIVWQVGTSSGALAISSDSQQVLTSLQVRHAADGSLIRTFQIGYSGSQVSAEAFSPDGTLAAIGIHAYNRNFFLIRVADGAILAGPLSPHLNGTNCVAFSPNGQLLASGGADGTVQIWHVPDMTLLKTLNGGVGYRPRVSAVLFNRDGSIVILGSQGGLLAYWVDSGQMAIQLTTVPTLSLALSPDGSLLASGSNQIDQYGQCVDCTIKLWRTTDGSPVGIIGGNNNGVRTLAFSPDQGQLAAGGGDRVYNGSVRFFDLYSGALIGTWYGDPNNVSSYVSNVVYSPYGRTVLYGRGDAVVASLDPF